MPKLQIFLAAGDRALETFGDVWDADAEDEDNPLVSDVNTRLGAGSWLVLEAGDYVYRFTVQGVSGKQKFTLEVDDISDGKTTKIDSRDYDTSIQRGLTCRFTVKK